MKRMLIIFLTVTTLLSCSKDDKVAGVDLSGKWVEVGITNNPPVWTFTNGVVTSGITKKGNYRISGDDLIVDTEGGNRLVYGVSMEGDVLKLSGKNEWKLGYDMKQNYNFKKYVEK